MSVPAKKRRSWGKPRPKEGVTVVDKDKIEATLQSLAEEAKKASLVAPRSDTSQNVAGFDLKLPELMNNDELVGALKRIKVPIPVYADGRPSRERLLYLYKTNVMPRPQRNRWKRGRNKRPGVVQPAALQQEEEEDGEMEVDHEGQNWSVNGTDTTQRKRKLSGSSDTEGISPCKKISSDISLTTITTPSAAPPTTTPPATTTPTSIRNNSTHRTVKLKRPAVAAAPVSKISTSTTSPAPKPHPPASRTPTINVVGTKSCDSPSSGVGDMVSPAAKKVCRAKITWP